MIEVLKFVGVILLHDTIEETLLALSGLVALIGSVVYILYKVIRFALIEIFDPVWGYDIFDRAKIRAERERVKEEKKRKKAEAKYWAEIEKKYR